MDPPELVLPALVLPAVVLPALVGLVGLAVLDFFSAAPKKNKVKRNEAKDIQVK